MTVSRQANDNELVIIKIMTSLCSLFLFWKKKKLNLFYTEKKIHTGINIFTSWQS